MLSAALALLSSRFNRIQAGSDSACELFLRPATSADLDAMTHVGLAALPLDPVWPYRYPEAQNYPEDHYKFSRLRFSEYLANAEAGACAIILAELRSAEASKKPVIIAMSMWQLPGFHTKSEIITREAKGHYVLVSPADHFERRDGSSARMEAFRQSIQKAKSEHFDQIYGENQLSLLILATHPNYHRNGAGKALVEWGLRKAKGENLSVTLFSSPMGLSLYSSLGFQQIGVFRAQVDGEAEYVDFPGMVWHPDELGLIAIRN